jgi:hypothetical protein
MKYLVCLGLSLAFAQGAVAQDRAGPYVGVSVGAFSYKEVSDVSGAEFKDTAPAQRISGGYRFNENFALEVGWGQTTELEDTFTLATFPNSTTYAVDAEFEAITVRALGVMPFDKVSMIYGIGYYNADISSTEVVVGFPLSTTSSESSQEGATLVGGLEWNFDRLDIRGELEWFDADDGAESWDFSVGVFFHF